MSARRGAGAARLPRGFAPLIGAQWLSALADNALLIVCVALLIERGAPAWWAPMLKFSFTVAYVLLAPGVGALADSFPKGRVMMAMNALKAAGLVGLALGLHPLAALAVVGVAAAAYAPAKYGLVTELVGPEGLVAANGWIEVTTVVAAVCGTVLGGFLVGAWFQGWSEDLGVTLLSPLQAQGDNAGALVVVFGLYLAAALLNLRIPDSGARYARQAAPAALLMGRFVVEQRRLWSDPMGGLSMGVTTLFWGAAAVLQFAVLRWAMDVLHWPLDRATYLQGAVACGIVVGAALAGRWVMLAQAPRVLPLGVVMGLLVPLCAYQSSWWLALPLMVLVGLLGGAMVVPLNALLQHRGHVLLSAGRSIAVQNFNENTSVLVMLAVYAMLLSVEVPIQTLMSALGLLVAGGVALLWRWRGVATPAPA